ncbi:MAG: ATP-binding protein [Rhodospirillales bacterium]|nr:ATP-binding protein [Rhodospirillales bacterium]
MGILLRSEIRALVEWARTYEQDEINGFLESNFYTSLVDIVKLPAIRPVWSVGVAQWVDARNDAASASAFLIEAERDRSAIPGAPMLRSAIARLAFVVEREELAGPPYEARLIKGVPVVNRTQLRAHLEQLTLGHEVPVVVVQGESGLGRSHSWHLIKHVSTKSGLADFVKVDMVEQILEKQTAKDVFELLTRRTGLTDGKAVSVDGVTAATLGARYASEFAERLRNAMPGRPRPLWIVLDSIDRPIEEPLKHFIHALASTAAEHELSNCTLFLLGPAGDFAPQDYYVQIRRESLTGFLFPEIEDACTRMNELGAQRLDPADLTMFVDELRQKVMPLSGRALCSAVCEGLVTLRQRVQA